MRFDDYISDFYQYMVTEGGLAVKTSHDYISRLRFLATQYELNDNLTESVVKEILNTEKEKRQYRDVYNSRKSISDFSAGLYKFLDFIKSDYHKRIEDSIISEIVKIEKSQSLKDTEKKAIVLSRIGQGTFRKELINYWGCCSVSGITSTWILIASHIKPWRVSNNNERLDVYNGLLLLPNLDKLFDKGYISFNTNGQVIYSKYLSMDDKKTLHLTDDLKLSKVNPNHIPYLKYHNNFCLL
ncbi:HNH endonuclease [Prevotella sp. tf2-5]|uniref:HNH endonuclease n=1 Tax=Prevotella sp. tf2-5 TaxID=1761889 RepID=UPI0008E4DF22|nr:HNH endonuclease signature motif containing protein [Prevotella sp. tf2-5]SFO80192.1 HNH endonuclease [Prevotella sp. tf2-5]